MVGPKRSLPGRGSSRHRRSKGSNAAFQHPRSNQPCKIVDGLCMTHGYSTHPNVPCPVGGKTGYGTIPNREAAISIMRTREIEQGKPADYEKRYNGYANWDTWNTLLLLENTQESYRWLGNWSKNFNDKIERGKFDPLKAESVVEKYLVPAARGRKSLRWAVGRDFVADPDIDPKKVNKAEIVRHVIEMND